MLRVHSTRWILVAARESKPPKPCSTWRGTWRVWINRSAPSRCCMKSYAMDSCVGPRYDEIPGSTRFGPHRTTSSCWLSPTNDETMRAISSARREVRTYCRRPYGNDSCTATRSASRGKAEEDQGCSGVEPCVRHIIDRFVDIRCSVGADQNNKILE